MLDFNPRFEKYISEIESMPFKWGTNDCTTLGVKYLEYFFGKTNIPDLTYKTRDEALEFIKTKRANFSEWLHRLYDVHQYSLAPPDI